MATTAGIGQTRYGAIERSESVRVFHATFGKIALALGVGRDDLWRQIGVNEPWDNNLQMSTMQRMQPIPTFDLAVAAGQWVEVGGEGIAPDLATFDRGVFRIRIAGDSMEQKYPSGSIVEFCLVQPDQDDVVPGRNYYWHRADNFATFKTLEKIEDETLTLRAINRKHYPKPLTVSRQEIVRIAVARGIFTPDVS